MKVRNNIAQVAPAGGPVLVSMVGGPTVEALPSGPSRFCFSRVARSEAKDPISRTMKAVVALAAMLGIALQLVSYPTPGVLVAIALFGVIGLSIVFTLTLGTGVEPPHQVFLVIYGALMLWTGIAHVYSVHLNDYWQNASDASTFFELSRATSMKQSLEDLRIDTVGGLSVYVARPIYNLFRVAGFPVEHYIGTLWNSMLVAICGALMYAQVPAIAPDDPRRAQRLFVLAYCTSGLLGMFGGLHLRDCYSLAMLTLQAVFWIRYIVNRSVGSLARLLVIVTCSALVAEDIRSQSVYQVWGICLIGLVIAISRRITTLRILVAGFLALLLLPLSVQTSGKVGSDDIELLQTRTAGYGSAVDSSTSLASRFVFELPAPVRVAAGSVYLHIFPIPFWSGYNEQSAYHLFKVFQVVWNFLLIPSFLVGAWKLGADIQGKVPGFQVGLFCLAAYLAGTGAVAATSLETRHHGQFLPLFIVVSCIGLSQRRIIWVQRLRNTALIFAIGLAVGYLLWAILKFR
jgi:hypothetical protein